MKKIFIFLALFFLIFRVFSETINYDHTFTGTCGSAQGYLGCIGFIPAGTFTITWLSGNDQFAASISNPQSGGYDWLVDSGMYYPTSVQRTYAVPMYLFAYSWTSQETTYSLHVTGIIESHPPVWNNKPYNFYIEVSPTAATSWEIDLNTLCTGAQSYSSSDKPAWLSINGSILGGDVPYLNTNYSFTVNATNEDGVAGASFTVHVTGATIGKPVLNGVLTFDAYKNSDFSVTLDNYFSGATSYSLGTGKPAWLLLHAGSTMSGLCPSDETAQNYVFPVTASNAVGDTVAQCTINIKDIINNDKLKITSPASVTSPKAFSYTPTTNKTNATITVGGLPSGITYSGGVVSGTIPDGVTGFIFSVYASASEQTSVSMVVTVTYSADGTGDGLAKHVIVDNFPDNKSNFADLENGIRQSNTYLSAINTSLGGVKSSIDTLTYKWDAMKEAVSVISTNTGTINTTLTNMNSTVSTLNNNVVTINTNLTDFKNQTIAKLQGIQDKQDQQTAHLQQISTNTGNLSGGLDDIKNKLDDTNNKLDTSNQNTSDIKDKMDDLSDMLKQSLPGVPDPDYTKSIYTVTTGELSFRNQFVALFQPRGKAPPVISLPLSALNIDGLVNLTDIPFDFERPEIVNFLALFRAMELGCFFIISCIIAIRITRSFEF